MRLSKKVRNGLLVLVILLVIGAACVKLVQYEIVRSYLVRWSDLEEITPNLYVDPTMPESQQNLLLSSVANSKERIRSLYGEYTANPVIIAGHTMEVMKVYGGNSYNRTGRTYLTPVATIIVLGPDGVTNRDVLSHELAHAEFSNRIGYWNRDEVPSWFDEGLAVQFDDRFAVAEGQSLNDNEELPIELDQLGTIKHNDRLGYTRSKQEVGRWLAAVGEEGFQDFLQIMRSGDSFQEVYRSIERTYSGTQ